MHSTRSKLKSQLFDQHSVPKSSNEPGLYPKFVPTDSPISDDKSCTNFFSIQLLEDLVFRFFEALQIAVKFVRRESFFEFPPKTPLFGGRSRLGENVFLPIN